MRLRLFHPERVEIGGEVAADAVGADDHDGADAVEHGLLDLILGHSDALLGRLAFDLFGDLLRLGPLAVEGLGQLVLGLRWPVGAGP